MGMSNPAVSRLSQTWEVSLTDKLTNPLIHLQSTNNLESWAGQYEVKSISCLIEQLTSITINERLF